MPMPPEPGSASSPGAISPSGPGPGNPSLPVTVLRLAAGVTFLAVAMGAVVCATRSGASCPTWPGCRPDRIAPAWQFSPIVEFTHRVVAVTAGPLVLASALLSVRLPRSARAPRLLPWLALACAIASGAFGRLVVLSTLPTWLGAVDLTCALTAMTVMGVAAVVAGRAVATGGTVVADGDGVQDAASPGTARTAWLAAAAVMILIVMHVSGIFAAGAGSYTRCMGWPLWRLHPGDLHPQVQTLRVVLAGLGAVLVLATVVSATRTARLRAGGAILAGLFTAEMLLGLVLRAQGLHDDVASAYSVVAVALLWALALLATVAAAGRAPGSMVPAAGSGRHPTVVA